MVSYSTPDVVLKAWDIDVHHPEIRMLSIEVNPRIGGGLQISIDAPGDGRVIVMGEELSRTWRQHRSSTGVPLPMKLRRTGQGPVLRWREPNGKRGTNSEQGDVTSASVHLAGSVAKAAWNAWRARKP